MSTPTRPSRPVFSVVVPIYYEEEVLPDTYRRITQVMDGLASRGS